MVTKAEAERLLAFTNNSGPLFIIGAVSSGILKMPEAGIFLYICHIMSCFTVGILFRFYNRSGNAKFRSKESFKGNHNPAGKNILQRLREDFYKKDDSEENFSIIFGDSIRNSIALILNIGGFVIFFSVIINVFIELELINNLSGIISVITGPLALNKGILNSIMCGFLEITTGVNHISSVANVSVVEKLTSASFIIGWAGLSVHSQVSSIISNSGISIKPYLIGKFMQGCFAGIYTYILAGFFDFTSKSSINTFNPADMKNQNFLHEKIILFFDSGLYAVIFLIVCIMVSYVSKKIIKVTEKKH